jgi:hypothetical protein
MTGPDKYAKGRDECTATPDVSIHAKPIDWAESGWYPAYWKYTAALFACSGWSDDWYVKIAENLEEGPDHDAWLAIMRHEMWDRDIVIVVESLLLKKSLSWRTYSE